MVQVIAAKSYSSFRAAFREKDRDNILSCQNHSKKPKVLHCLRAPTPMGAPLTTLPPSPMSASEVTSFLHMRHPWDPHDKVRPLIFLSDRNMPSLEVMLSHLQVQINRLF